MWDFCGRTIRPRNLTKFAPLHVGFRLGERLCSQRAEKTTCSQKLEMRHVLQDKIWHLTRALFQTLDRRHEACFQRIETSLETKPAIKDQKLDSRLCSKTWELTCNNLKSHLKTWDFTSGRCDQKTGLTVIPWRQLWYLPHSLIKLKG